MSLQSKLFEAASGHPAVRVPDRRTKVISDSVKMPALFPGTNLAAVPKMHGNVCLSPAWALFPDRGYLKIDLANSNRQISDAPDGFRSIAGCNMRHCIAPQLRIPHFVICIVGILFVSAVVPVATLLIVKNVGYKLKSKFLLRLSNARSQGKISF